MKALALSCVVLCLPVLAATPARVTLELRPQAQVPSGIVCLGQVARVASGELALVRLLSDLPIGPAPQAGDGVTLQREALAEWIWRRTGLDPSRVQWEGPASSRVLGSVRSGSGGINDRDRDRDRVVSSIAAPVDRAPEPPPATALPAVLRGQWVALRAAAGAVRLEARAEALQDGRPGQSVRVRPGHGGGTLLARVVGPGQVEVLP